MLPSRFLLFWKLIVSMTCCCYAVSLISWSHHPSSPSQTERLVLHPVLCFPFRSPGTWYLPLCNTLLVFILPTQSRHIYRENIIFFFFLYTCTGYENQDWFISVPVLDPNQEIDLTPELIKETLNYFIISSERLSQMTRTYHDIDAVTRLLQEVRLYDIPFLP